MIIPLLAALAVGVVFLYSGLSKLADTKGFLLVVLEYRVLPPRLAHVYAFLLPVVEVFAALLLLGGAAVRIAGLLIAALLLSFLIAVSVNLGRGRTLDCHCFGPKSHRRIGWGLVAGDVALLAGDAIVLVSAQTHGWLADEPWPLLAVAKLASPDAALPMMAFAAAAAIAAAVYRWSRWSSGVPAATGSTRHLDAHA